ncbi:hypothetical protein [Clostridium perfringens]|uniref:hypothetical protein n=1 Tax=Clostridium perfringens TaxID=1502 RepID=UPI003B02BBF0
MDIDFSYINENGKKVSGSAALIHHVYTEAGGIKNYNDEVGEEYIKDFIKTRSKYINKSIEKKFRKRIFKAI